ncbi:hypothetical protein AB0F71_28085 [Kitasatospora sp. NPDC028055]|uniref:hypothetical protein n=1 Tax=unclassified Kitasatospora TaxID=2633591 RepID=UPI0033E69295
MRRAVRRLAVLAAAPLIALTGATAAQALPTIDTSSYSVTDGTGTCSINVHFYYSSHWYVQYDLINWGNGTQGCEAGAYTSDQGWVGHITSGSYSTSDDPSRYVRPWVQKVGDPSSFRWGNNR